MQGEKIHRSMHASTRASELDGAQSNRVHPTDQFYSEGAPTFFSAKYATFFPGRALALVRRTSAHRTARRCVLLLQSTTAVLDVVDNDVELTYTPAIAAITLTSSSAMQVEVAYHIHPLRVERGSQERRRKG